MGQKAGNHPAILIERGSYETRCGYVSQDSAERSYRTPATPLIEQFKFIFERVLKVDPALYEVVLIKDTGTPQQVLQQEARILFTEFHVKACAFMNAQAGIIFSWVNQESSGLVIDTGYDATRIVPIIDLIPEMALVAVLPLAGRTLEHFITEQLHNTNTPATLIENYREQLLPYLMKEHCYFEASSNLDFEREAIEVRKKRLTGQLTLGSGSQDPVDISLPNPVFPASLVTKKSPTRSLSFSSELNQQVVKVLENIRGTDTNQWRLGRILITGGASHVLGLRSLLIRELLKDGRFKRLPGQEKSPASPVIHLEFQGRAFTLRSIPLEETSGPWIGASIAFSLSESSKIFVSSETFQDHPDIEFTLDHPVSSFY